MAFYDTAVRFSDHIMVKDDREQEITYGEMDVFASKMGNLLKARSIVFCLCENSVGSVVGYLSFLKNRVVPLLLDRKIDRELFAHLIEVYRPGFLYYPSDMEQEMKNRFPGFLECRREYDYILAYDADTEAPVLYEELGLLLTTSGSTGSPKFVRQSYQNIQSNAEAIARYLELDDAERPVTTLPMNYTYGLSVINSHVQVGATILLTDKTMVMKQFWDFMKREHATSFAGVPFTYELLKKVRFFRMDLPDLRYMTQAGGKLSP
ncbi:MAG: AMP-binding protein, partial [Clostridiales bacterium]|nr:AMP-binding protein [Clostridiales bacterium]